MPGMHPFGMLGFGVAPAAPALPPTTAPSATVNRTAARRSVESLAEGPAQSLALGGGPTYADTLAAMLDGGGPVFCNEQAADTAATDTRTIDVFTAGTPVVLREVALVFDADVPPMLDAYATFTAGRVTAAGVETDGLTGALASDVGFLARTKRSLVWHGFFELAAGEALIVAVGKVGPGVKLPKFSVIGFGRLT